MRHLTLLGVVAAAAATLSPTPAAAYDCPFEQYGVQEWGVKTPYAEAGVCSGGWCTDLCGIVLDPYCVAPAGSPLARACALVDPIGWS